MESVRPSAKTELRRGCGVMPLLLADPLQGFLDRGHGVRRVDEREGAA